MESTTAHAAKKQKKRKAGYSVKIGCAFAKSGNGRKIACFIASCFRDLSKQFSVRVAYHIVLFHILTPYST